MVYAIVGSRKFGNKDLVLNILTIHLKSKDRIVSGGAPGPDSWADEFSRDLECEFLRIPAKWMTLGKRAGFARNPQIIDAADRVIAFWDGKSNGTRSSIRYAHSKSMPVKIVYPDGRIKTNEHWK